METASANLVSTAQTLAEMGPAEMVACDELGLEPRLASRDCASSYELVLSCCVRRGYDGTDTLGDEAGEMANLATVNLGSATAVAISAGSQHTCAILNTFALKCWGRKGSHNNP